MPPARPRARAVDAAAAEPTPAPAATAVAPAMTTATKVATSDPERLGRLVPHGRNVLCDIDAPLVLLEL